MRDLTSWLLEPRPDAGINYYDGKRWARTPYPEFAREVLASAAALRAQGLGAEDRIALVLRSGPAFARYFFAAIAIGATPTPLAPEGYQGPMDYATFAAQRFEALRPTGVVSEGGALDLLAGLPAPEGGTRPVLVDAAAPLPADGDRTRAVLAKDDLALIQFTSGSSSAPRGVTLTSEAVLSQVDLLQDKYAIDDDCVFGSWLPVHHDMGLIGLFVTPIVLGCELWLMRPEHFVRSPLEWLRVFGEHRGTHAAIPNFALDRVLRRVKAEHLQGMDFSRWKSLIVGSDRVSMPMLEGFHALLSPFGLPAHGLSPSYGMAEATLAVSGVGVGQEPHELLVRSPEFSTGHPVDIVERRMLTDTRPRPEGLHSIVSCGTELLGADLTVTGEDGRGLPDGHVGELLVRSPALSQGYFGAPPEDERFTTGGYRTGDLGFRHEDEIYVLGRLGDSVKVNGRYVTAEDVELALSRAFGLPQDKITVVLNSQSGVPVTLTTVQRRAADVDEERFADVLEPFGLAAGRALLLHVGALAVPRTTSGKPQRGLMWRTFASGDMTGTVLFRGTDFPYELVTDAGSGRSRVAAADAVGTARPVGTAGPLVTAGPVAAAGRAGTVRTADTASPADTASSAGAARPVPEPELGGKGRNLRLMAERGLPVPPFRVFDAVETAGGVDEVSVRAVLAELTGAATDTMAVSAATVGFAVRSSPPRSMPGMMDTLLGIGLTPDDVGPLARRLGSERAAWNVLVTQAKHLARYVGGAGAARLVEAESAHEAPQRFEQLCALYTELTGQPYPADPSTQVRVALEAVRASWDSARAQEYRRVNRIPDTPGPAVVVQALSYGMADGVSGSGVVFSHNPVNGDSGLFGEYLAGSTGEDLVSGTRTPMPISVLKDRDDVVFGQLSRMVTDLYHVLGAMVEVEFVVERGRLWLVQVRAAAAAPHVLNRVTRTMWQEGRLDARGALARLDVDALFRPLPAAVTGDHGEPLATGLSACAGVGYGQLVRSVEEVLEHPPGHTVLLRPATEPEDFVGMSQAAAVVTLQGGGTSHAAVVARELNVPTVVGVQLSADAADVLLGEREDADLFDADEALPEVTVCGTSGRVWWGRLPSTVPPPDSTGAEELLHAGGSTTAVCLAAGVAEGGSPVLLDAVSGAPLALAAPEGPAAPEAGPVRAVRCGTTDELRALADDTLVATDAADVAEEWTRRGGRAAYLHTAVDAERPWRTDLPSAPPAFVVLADARQVPHARWSLAVAWARQE
ncbi:AMP-binding protein [Streptomyces venezuelae]|uniref:AMP-binding protein n=1 Tax=Streptomyces venezuelae TaxID=54571 RepID=UPI0034271060